MAEYAGGSVQIAGSVGPSSGLPGGAGGSWASCWLAEMAATSACLCLGQEGDSKTGFCIDRDWGCDGEAKRRGAPVAVWSRAVCLCEADG